jgi:cytochrome c5
MPRRAPLLVLIALCLTLVAQNANAYPRYHPADTTNDISAYGVCEGTTDACQVDGDCAGASCIDINRGCYQCHGWDDDANPVAGTDTTSPFRNDGFDNRGPLHDLHVTMLTVTCELCHQQRVSGMPRLPRHRTSSFSAR